MFIHGLFFYCLNVRNKSEGFKKKEAVLQPYTNVDDPRFDWLENSFLKYFSDWRSSTINRPGNFTQNAMERMFLSWQTYAGLKITVYSVIIMLLQNIKELSQIKNTDA